MRFAGRFPTLNTPFTLAASLSLCQLFTVDLSYCECKSLTFSDRSLRELTVTLTSFA